MSEEIAKQFVEKLKTDEAFKKEFEALGSDDERKEFVKKAGFVFSKDDIKAAFKSMGKQQLSEDDLESVAGGSSATWVETGSAAVGAAAGVAAAVAAAF